MCCDGYEVSAHSGARATHKVWQGGQYSIYPHPYYPLFNDVVGYQMQDANCRHTKWGIFLGYSTPRYTNEQLQYIDPEPPKLTASQREQGYIVNPEKPYFYIINEKQYNFKDFEAVTQKQRSLERAIRQTKRQIIAYQSAELKEEENIAKSRLRTQQQIYNDFSKQSNLPKQIERLGVYDLTTNSWR